MWYYITISNITFASPSALIIVLTDLEQTIFISQLTITRMELKVSFFQLVDIDSSIIKFIDKFFYQ